MKSAEEILQKIWRRSCMYPMVDMDTITIKEVKEAMEAYAEQFKYQKSEAIEFYNWITMRYTGEIPVHMEQAYRQFIIFKEAKNRIDNSI